MLVGAIWLFGSPPVTHYDITKTWLLAMVLATAIPSAIGFLCSRRWQFTLRHVFLATAVLALALGVLREDLVAIWLSFHGPDTHFARTGSWSYVRLEHFGEWSHVMFGLVMSGIFTWAWRRSAQDRAAQTDSVPGSRSGSEQEDVEHQTCSRPGQSRSGHEDRIDGQFRHCLP